MENITEKQNSKSIKIDRSSTLEILSIINEEDKKIAAVIQEILPAIALVVDCIVDNFKKGGRLFYFGCGTSGRLGVLDASECPPTFSVNSKMVQGVIAGGNKALVRSVENAEDSSIDGKKSIKKNKINDLDTVIGLSAIGTANYVHGALIEAKKRNATTVLICCNPYKKKEYIDYLIHAIVGPEIIAGSTRMKAGTATKMILNMISTTSMIKLNKVYNNLMVDVNVNNKKLFNRAINIISSICSCSLEDSKLYLNKSNGNVKAAIIMKKKAVNLSDSILLLNKYDGNLRSVLEHSKSL